MKKKYIILLSLFALVFLSLNTIAGSKDPQKKDDGCQKNTRPVPFSINLAMHGKLDGLSKEDAKNPLLVTQTEAAKAKEVQVIEYTTTMFAQNMFKNLVSNQSNQNNVFSAYNLFQLLLLLSNGAPDEQKLQFAAAIERMLGVIHAAPISLGSAMSLLKMHNDSFKVSMEMLGKDLGEGNEIDFGTGLFSTDPSFNFSTADIEDAQSVFNAIVMNNASLEDINGYVSDKTRKLITTLFDQLPQPAAIVTTLYLKGIWENMFEKDQTRESNFYSANGSIQLKVPMMNQKSDFAYTENDFYQAVSVPFKSGRLMIDVIVPNYDKAQDEYARDDYTSILNYKKLLEYVSSNLPKVIEDLNNAQTQEVDLYLPKYMAEGGIENAMPMLNEMGIPNFKYSGLNVSKIVHKAVYKQDEVGAEFAAASGAALESISMAKTFKANRPFIWILRDTKTGIIIGGPSLIVSPQQYK